MNVINDMQDNCQVFVAEMGMDHQGELKNTTKLFPLDFGVITTINHVHIEKLGSITKLANAKGELLHGIKNGGTAILNEENKYINKLGKMYKGNIVWFNSHPLLNYPTRFSDDFAAALTKGKITIKNANVPDTVDGIIQYLSKFNIKKFKKGKDIVVDGSKPLKIDLKNSGMPLAGDDLPKFSPRPWPGYPVDALPQVISLACKLNGRILIQNWMYESGLEFCRELSTMGANIFICDPQRVIVSGPAKFKSTEVYPPDVIQAIMAIFLVALCDPVETTINNAHFLLRRYPNIIKDYRKLGAKIEIIEE